MKNGKRPNKAQKILLASLGFYSDDWLICKNTSTEITIVHRFTGSIRIIPKRRNYDEQ